MSVEKSAATPVLVAAVDNDRMALLALKGILPQLLPAAQWMWGAGTADEAVAKALDPETRPKLLMVDMSLGDATGVSACRKIRMRTDRVLLLGVTAFSVSTYAERIAGAGASGLTRFTLITRRARVQSVTRSTTLWREPRGIERIKMPLFVTNGLDILRFLFLHRADAEALSRWTNVQ